jgi:GntR family transcriptional regulator
MAKERPLYERTADAIAGILQHTEPGAFLPSEPALAKQLGVSRATLREAMRAFEERGMIVRRQGVGTYVTSPPTVIETGLDELRSIESLASEIGLPISMGELEIDTRICNPEECETFQIASDSEVLEISRVIHAKERPVAYLEDVLPAGVLPVDSIGEEFAGSVLDLLIRRADIELDCSKTDITAVSAAAHVARHLRIQRGDVLLLVEAGLYTKANVVIDRSRSYFLPGLFRFHVQRKVGDRPQT